MTRRSAGGQARGPTRLDLVQPALAAHMLVGRHARDDVGVGAEQRRVAAQQTVAQGIDACREHRPCSRPPSCRAAYSNSEAKTDKIGGGPDGAGVGREVEQHDGDLAVGARLCGAARRCARRGRPAWQSVPDAAPCRGGVRHPRRWSGRRTSSARCRRRVPGSRPSSWPRPAADRAGRPSIAPASGIRPDGRRCRARPGRRAVPRRRGRRCRRDRRRG